MDHFMNEGFLELVCSPKLEEWLWKWNSGGAETLIFAGAGTESHSFGPPDGAIVEVALEKDWVVILE